MGTTADVGKMSNKFESNRTLKTNMQSNSTDIWIHTFSTEDCLTVGELLGVLDGCMLCDMRC